MPLGVAIATGLFQLLFFDRWFSAMDEGHILYYADLVNQGGMLYRDATIYPLPGAFYLLAAFFDVFGPSNLVARWVVLVEFSLFVALLFLWMRRLVPERVALLAVFVLWLYRIWAFPHWQMYGYSTTALLLLVASAVILLRSLEQGSRPLLAAAGLLFGLGVFCKQDYSAAALLALLPTLWVAVRSSEQARRSSPVASLAVFLGPAALVGALAGLHFWQQGQLAWVVQITALRHFVGMASYDYPAFPALLPLFVQDPALRSAEGIANNLPALIFSADFLPTYRSWLFRETALYDTWAKLVIYGPLGLLAFGAVRLLRARASFRGEARIRDIAELLLFGFAFGLMVVAYFVKPQDYTHLAVLYWPLLLLSVLYLQDFAASSRLRGRVLVAALVVPVLVIGAYSARLVWKLRITHDTPVAGERAGIYVKPHEAALLDELVSYVQSETRPGDRVAIMPYFTILHFLADRQGPHAASYIVWPFPEYPDRDARVVEAMEAQDTALVLWSFTQFQGLPPASEYAAGIYDYLIQNFETDRIFNRDLFAYKMAALKREAASAQGRVLFDGRNGRVATVSERGPATRVPEAERARYSRAAKWPFRPVVTLRPSAQPRRTTLSRALRVPEKARLETAISVHPDEWFSIPPSWVRFEIAVLEAGKRELIFGRTLDPHRKLEDRGWFEIDLPLDSYAGRRVTLELSTSTQRALGEREGMAAFALPRLATPATFPP